MSKINPAIFKAYDIRGIVATDLTPDTVQLIGQAFGSESLQKNCPQVVIARDGRLHSEQLSQSLLMYVTRTFGFLIEFVPQDIVTFPLEGGGLDFGLFVILKESMAIGKYDGKLVRVIGVAYLEFESNGIYLSKEHLENAVTKNALWIEINSQAVGKTEKELSKYNGQYVLVEGVFMKDNTGHMGLKSGSIMNITRFEPWPPEIVKERLKKKG